MLIRLFPCCSWGCCGSAGAAGHGREAGTGVSSKFLQQWEVVRWEQRRFALAKKRSRPHLLQDAIGPRTPLPSNLFLQARSSP